MAKMLPDFLFVSDKSKAVNDLKKLQAGPSLCNDTDEQNKEMKSRRNKIAVITKDQLKLVLGVKQEPKQNFDNPPYFRPKTKLYKKTF